MKKINFAYWILFVIFPIIPIIGGLFYAIKGLIQGDEKWWHYLLLALAFFVFSTILVLAFN